MACSICTAMHPDDCDHSTTAGPITEAAIRADERRKCAAVVCWYCAVWLIVLLIALAVGILCPPPK